MLLLITKAHAFYPVDSNNEHSCTGKNQAQMNQAIYKMADVNNWANIIGIPDQSFDLFSAKGVKQNRLARTGDLIRIKLPMDPTRGDYWVKVEGFRREGNFSALRVRPTRDPFLPYEDHVTDHFFTDRAQNVFSVSLKNGILKVRVHGTGEEANTTQARSYLDAQRNQIVASMGWGYNAKGEEMYGFQSMVWKIFARKIAGCK